jgi:beta-lactam-binding protein with PASTA domain
LAGLSIPQAQDALRQMNLTIDHQSEQPLKGKDNGLICGQTPPAGSSIAPDVKISVTVVNNIGF